MQKFKLTLAAVAFVSVLPMLQGCVAAVATGAAVGVMSAYDRRTTGVQTDDETTEWKAQQRVPDRIKAASHINFTSYNRYILITGEVPNDEAKASVAELAGKLDNVKGVYNELGIGPVSTLTNRSNDGYITSKVKARLVDSNQISANHVKVITEAGTVYLMGLVNEREAKVAVAVARTTSGVRKVVNVMEIVSESETQRIDSAMPRMGRSAPAPAEAPVETR